MPFLSWRCFDRLLLPPPWFPACCVSVLFVLSNRLGRCKMLNNMWCDVISIYSAKQHLVRFTALGRIWANSTEPLASDFGSVDHVYVAALPSCSRTPSSASITSCSFLSPHSLGLNSALNPFICDSTPFICLTGNEWWRNGPRLAPCVAPSMCLFCQNRQVKPFFLVCFKCVQIWLH